MAIGLFLQEPPLGEIRENARWRIFYGTDVQITGGTYFSSTTTLDLFNNTGGTIMGTSPGNSAVNKYQQSWDCHNLFLVGANVFPHNSAYQPTGLVGAMAYWTADAIKNKYLKNPGLL